MAGGTIAPPAIKFLVFLGHDKNKNSVTYNDMNEECDDLRQNFQKTPIVP